MNESIVMTIGGFALIYAILFILGITLHDMRQILSRAQQKQHPYARRYRQRPRVTVILYLDHHLADLEIALSNLLADHYRKLDITLVVPPQLYKSVRARVARTKSRRSIHIYANRHTEFSTAVRQAYRQFNKGDLVAIFDHQHLPTAHFVSRAVVYFNRHHDVPAAYTTSLTTSSYSILGLFQTYGNIVHSLYQKVLSGLDLPVLGDIISGTVYRRSTFLDLPQHQSPQSKVIHYASELTVVMPAATSLRSLLQNQFRQQRETLRLLWAHSQQPYLIKRAIALPLLLAKGAAIPLTPLAVGYCLFMAIQLHQPLFLSIITLLYVGVLLIAIIENEALRPIQKALYIGLSPITPIAAFLLTVLWPWNILWHLVQLRPVARPLRKQV